MDRAVLLFVFLSMLAACNKEEPVSSPSEKKPLLEISLLHPRAGPVPVQVSQTDDSPSPGRFPALNSSGVSAAAVGSSTPLFSIPAKAIREVIKESGPEENNITGAEFVSVDKAASALSSNLHPDGGAKEGISTAQTAPSPPLQLSIPQLTFEQIFHSELVTKKMGGSDQYRQYMADTLVYLNDSFRINEKVRKEFAFLCDDSLCSKGLNLDDLSANDMAKMLYKLGKYDQIQHIAPFNTIVLQGTVTKESEFEQLAGKMRQIINANRIDSLWINLSHSWDHLEFMLELGKFIRDNAINLRIIGRCSDACANYLIPATYQVSKVIMEPGSYIFYGGGYAELYREMQDRFQDNRMAFIQRFNDTYFSQGERKGVEDILLNAEHAAAHFMLSGPSALNGLNRFLSERRKIFWGELSEDEKRRFLSHVSQTTVTEIKNKAFIQSDAHQSVLRTGKMLNRLKNMARQEEEYYETLNAPAGELSYFDLVRLTTALVKQSVYEEYFIVDRKTLVPEMDVSYRAVAPSTDILRQSGIDIQGENHREIMESIYGDSESVLMLDYEDIQKYL